ncbi:hypothetical protein [Natronoglomus mannanivorans]|uniref:Uncharacterized protein n=1 Tax=Natronoglomus mannanivorans TaxID=2979990 RepID=A0AAP3E3Z8_9EURY|nr:hypothetical protein [Halobacteria archaeon AArc-xg1-1]
MNLRLLLLLAAVIGLVVMGASAPVASGSQSPVEDAVSMSTSYDGTTPSQEIEVVLTIEPTDSKLTDVVVQFQPGPMTLIETTSYASTVRPSNHDVSVTSNGQNRFVIQELEPGETVEIAFTVVPTTLGEQQLTPASADVELTRNGQRLDAEISEEVTLTQNPWTRETSSRGTDWGVLAGIGIAVGLVTTGVSTAMFRRKRRTRRKQVLRAVEDQANSVKRAGNQTVERQTERLVEEVRSVLDSPDDTDGEDSDDGSRFSSPGPSSDSDADGEGGSGSSLFSSDSSDEDSSGPNL